MLRTGPVLGEPGGGRLYRVRGGALLLCPSLSAVALGLVLFGGGEKKKSPRKKGKNSLLARLQGR